ncbi:endonuclease/exonuclease/phosphatase family protein [Luteolibacter yonseiensis]|uniref:Endonuclease/exonuclease/phosphatase family protein n=1 Tax=Luteolibacter yonseiensis TaxID=1144680 RepID=A0A934R4B0_9BACT|nr:endonuclease/exonuclease/phosphatase family protein [Luteolibacter yonseiensis]MBK1818148.1 endonuclease/exonuclease/phosphatase family protein [Luteolibacter yonseiensis]
MTSIRAPRILGAVFAAAVLFCTACEKSKTPDWNTPAAELPTSSEATGSPPPPQPLAAQAGLPENSRSAKTGHAESSAPATPSNTGLRFVTYNVQNWLTMDRYVERKSIKGAPKPESEKQDVVRMLVRHSPDIIGLCEVGTAADLADLQERLKTAGLNLPHTHFTGGSDPVRHLGLLSRFPILSTAKPSETSYQLDGQTFAINRGILDATLEVRGKSYRFLGVHLKSKRDVEQGDQEAMRLHESRLLRRHVDSILKENPNARLVVYGDFNDTRASPSLKTITGNYSDPTYLTAIPAKDSRQMAWTHYWEFQDIYSRIDYIMVTRALKKDVDFPAAKIIDDEEWNKASDHRPVLAIFK